MQEPLQCAALFSPLFNVSDFNWLLEKRPLLSHYTTIEVLEKILRTKEIWFSNPLFMNDFQELGLGMIEGAKLFDQSDEVEKACGSQARGLVVKSEVQKLFRLFEANHAIDTFIFCLSQHDAQDNDGVLSMWRAYGGIGRGASLVFNTGFVTENNNSPLILTKVRYETYDSRISLLKQKISQWCGILKEGNLPNAQLIIAAKMFFQAIKIFALTVKHSGFKEENEWRLIYTPDLDVNNILSNRINYNIRNGGVEPKLKFKIEPFMPDSIGKWSFDSILERIILGPSISTPLTKSSTVRMVQLITKDNITANKIVTSSIPFRTV